MTGLSSTAAILVAVALIVLSAFFVAVEFALVAARRHRLADAAARSVAARAALRSSRDLSLLLAGCQLGITLCTLGLGAVAKPAVHDLLSPLLGGWGLPAVAADALAFVLALVVVTFLHLVVGEMAPKSWAIAHPERSAVLLALPMRAFLLLTRPLLVALNGLANALLRRCGVQPVDEIAAGRTAETLAELVDHSAAAGALDRERRDRLLTALQLDHAVLGDLARPASGISGVAASEDVTGVRAATRRTGHLRHVVWRGRDAIGMVHVRDTLAAPAGTIAADLVRPVLTLGADQPVSVALATMRRERTQFALVRAGPELVGLVTMQDLLDRLLAAGRAG